MKPEWCPQWATDEATRVYHSLENSHVLNEDIIARSLLDARQRGRREGMEEAAEVVRQHVPTIPVDGPTDPIQEAEYFALGHALIDIHAKAQEVKT